MTRRILPAALAGVALLGVVALGFRGTASRAQTTAEKPPAAAAETLEQKVARLERQVADLQKQVEELKRRPAVTFAPADPNPYYNLTNPRYQPGLPPGVKPFDFNGETYYHIPIRQQGR